MDTETLVARMRRAGADLADVEVQTAVAGFPKDLLATLSAFANANGGVVLLGLDERRGFTPAPGFDAPRMRDALAGACADLMEPPLRVSVDIEPFEDALVVRADIVELDPVDKPCFVKNRGHYQGSYIRGGDGDRLLSHYEASQLLSNRTQPTHDVEVVTDATMDDLATELVQSILARARRRAPRTFGDVDDLTALVRLRAVAEVEGILHPTLAGLLCLGEYPQQFFPQLFVSFVALPGLRMGEQTDDGVRFLDNQTIDGAVPLMLAEATRAVRRNMRSASVIRGLGREDRYDYPLTVIRELLINALMHRDYSPHSRGTQVQVELYPDRLVVKSPGGLYGGTSVHLLGTAEQVPSSRNAALAKLLADIPLLGFSDEAICEHRGSGLPSVMAALSKVGMSPPEFRASPGHLRVTVPQHALLSVDTIEWIGSLEAGPLSDTQHLALAMMRSTGRATNAMLQAWGADRASASAALRDLVDRNLAVMSGGKRYASYELSDPADRSEDRLTFEDLRRGNLGDPARPGGSLTTDRYARPGRQITPGVRADLDAMTQAIRAGHVTARSLERALNLSYRSVLRRLELLRERGIVEATQSTHAPGQTYRFIEGSES